MKDVLPNFEVVMLPSGSIVRPRQRYRDLQVDNRGFTIVFNKKNEVTMVIQNTIPIEPEFEILPTLAASHAINTAKLYLSYGAVDHTYSQLLIHNTKDGPRLSYLVGLQNSSLIESWIIYIDAHTGEVLSATETLDRQSVDGTGSVYIADPVSLGRTVYGEWPFVDANDATNAYLDLYRQTIILKDITKAGSNYLLAGPLAEVAGPIDNYVQQSPYYNFTRNEDAFEAAMCYYFLDMSRRYTIEVFGDTIKQGGGGIPGQPAQPIFMSLSYEPHAYNANNAAFTGNEMDHSKRDFLEFGDGQFNVVDAAEGPTVILHELGHALHHWATSQNHMRAEGLSEGCSDYWSMSYSRSLGIWPIWDSRYDVYRHWALKPVVDSRTTNFTEDYKPEEPFQNHIFGQHWSTVLMRIYDDIGRTKTDLLFLTAIHGLSNDLDEETEGVQARAANVLYTAAVNLGYSESDLCAIHKHLKWKYGNHTEFTVTNSGTLVDVYIRDSNSDFGDEPNQNIDNNWNSPDIWVRNNDDGGLQHQNPVFSSQPNYVYVRIRGRGCQTTNDAKLRVYFSRASTGLEWPSRWNNYYEPNPIGTPVLSGDELTDDPIDIPPIQPGSEEIIGDDLIVKIPWYLDDPNELTMDVKSFALLARVESVADPMNDENPDVSALINATKNNNVALHNVVFVDKKGTQGVPILIGIEDNFSTSFPQNISLKLHDTPGSPSCLTQGELYISLQPTLRQLWETSGKTGTGFVEQQDGRLKVVDSTFTIGNFQFVQGENYLIGIEFDPIPYALRCRWEIEHNDGAGSTLGGFTFQYNDSSSIEQLAVKSNFAFHNEDDVSDEARTFNDSDLAVFEVILYPNPVSEFLEVVTNQSCESLTIVDMSGRVIEQVKIVENGNVNYWSMQLDVSELVEGLYFIQFMDSHGRLLTTEKFIKI